MFHVHTYVSMLGHGKSAFLKSLGGLLNNDKHFNGEVTYNGITKKQAKKNNIDLNSMVVYVNQVDIHMPLLTVRETLQFAVDNSVADPVLLNNPDIIELHKQKVELMIQLLGMQECSNTIVGNEMIRG